MVTLFDVISSDPMKRFLITGKGNALWVSYVFQEDGINQHNENVDRNTKQSDTNGNKMSHINNSGSGTTKDPCKEHMDPQIKTNRIFPDNSWSQCSLLLNDYDCNLDYSNNCPKMTRVLEEHPMEATVTQSGRLKEQLYPTPYSNEHLFLMNTRVQEENLMKATVMQLGRYGAQLCSTPCTNEVLPPSVQQVLIEHSAATIIVANLTLLPPVPVLTLIPLSNLNTSHVQYSSSNSPQLTDGDGLNLPSFSDDGKTDVEIDTDHYRSPESGVENNDDHDEGLEREEIVMIHTMRGGSEVGDRFQGNANGELSLGADGRGLGGEEEVAMNEVICIHI